MSFGEGNLHERVDELEREGASYRERWMERGAYIAKQRERIEQLESLVLAFKAHVEEYARYDLSELDDAMESAAELGERMAALGLLERG